ncbi:unnamed protein product [Clonostachys rosea f. rosea IK726]|uniref:Uncharacterized protein n=1 Tax=Clonostachys rosea f. rosea IK726 TaxID=1349383 RepID=A0ACA9UTE5_BIOOC|nr:unnamed protein product [Clonostachys rosea f. rosea IK726]
MAKCTSCGRFISTLQALLQQLDDPNLRDDEHKANDEHNEHNEHNKYNEHDQHNQDDEDDDHAEGDQDGENDKDGNSDGGDERERQTGVYVCPEDECRGRKPDKDFRRFSRHHDIHVPCIIRCPGCLQTLYRVSLLKRHYRECVKLKKLQSMAEHEGATNEMKREVRKASNKASREARVALETCKRRHEPSVDDSTPQKKARFERCPTVSIPTSPAKVHGMVTSNSHSPSAYAVDDETSAQNGVTAIAGTLESMNQTMHALAAYQERNDTTDEAAVDTHNQYTTEQSSAIDARTPSRHSTNIQYLTTKEDGPFVCTDDQYSAEQNAAPLRSSSFLTNTMDGSLVNDHYLAEQSATTLRSSSFLTNTMDGSFVDDHYLAEQNAAALRSSSFLTNTMDGSVCNNNLGDGLPHWGPQGFA